MTGLERVLKEARLKRAVADLRADLERDKGGLIRVFADQLEAVLDALEDKPDLVVSVNPKDIVSVPKEWATEPEDPLDVFKGENGLYHVGFEVKTTKKIDAYPSLKVGAVGEITGHNVNSGYVYRVKFEDYHTSVNLTADEIGLKL